MHRLTDREREILLLAAQGFTRPQVANILGISYETVVSHCNRVMDKLGSNSRINSVYIATKDGLID